jgi:hypothetical protein
MLHTQLKPARFLGLAILVSAALPNTAKADLLNIAWDNDLLTGSDRGYTNGLVISYLTAPAQDQQSSSASVARAATNALNFLPGISSPGKKQALAFSLRQLMVTPENITADPPNTNDLPYAGYLSAGSTLWSYDADTITGYGVHIGVIGSESGAEASQKFVHKLTGSDDPEGWDSQLGTDVVGGFDLAHGRKLVAYGSEGELQQEFAVVGSAALSSFRTSLGAGAIWRTGRNLPANFIPDYAGASSTIGLPGALDHRAPGWSVFIGLGLDVVPYSYLDKNSSPYRYEESLLQGQIGVGGSMHWDRLQVSLTVRATTGEDQTNKDNFSFGSLAVTWAL